MPSPEQIGAACRALVQRAGGAGPNALSGTRSFFTRFAQQQQLHSLEKKASAAPGDAAKQAEYLKKLNMNDPEAGGSAHAHDARVPMLIRA